MFLLCEIFVFWIMKNTPLKYVVDFVINWVVDAGHFPEWDEDHPIHFVGHSAGAQVVRVLQQMLADKVDHKAPSNMFMLRFSFSCTVVVLSYVFVMILRHLKGMRPLRRTGF